MDTVGQPTDAGPLSTRARTKVVMIPSVSGGIGHISRTASLSRALVALDPRVEIEYLLDTERLRPFNIDATRRMGFRPRFLPPRSRDTRDGLVRACLDDAHVVVDDCARYLLPLRQAVPQVGWVSIAMHPIGDELFMDWPLMAQMDAVIWPYAPLVDLPAEIAIVADKVVQTGPFLETDTVPEKEAARAQLGLRGAEPLVLYAPRGFPFGREFGHRVLGGIYGALAAMRRGAFPQARLILLAVADLADLRGVPGMPDPLPNWVQVKGVVTPAEALLHTRAADAVVGEGTSTMHEGAALRTPLVLAPGPIQEATLLARKLGTLGAAQVLSPEATTPDGFAAAFTAALLPGMVRETALDRAQALVTGGGGALAAARLVLDVAARCGARGTRPAAFSASEPL
ncbi:MAG: hypothetical protein JO157_05250 [Acetobacteraceae bacterium]|nr:hypothetical protein [Acetobacteraceae bacterium]